MVTVSAPGKLILAGEWSVLESGHSCIVLPVNKFINVTVKDSDKYFFSAPDLGLDSVCFSFDNGHIDFSTPLSDDLQAKAELTRLSIETVFNYLVECNVRLKHFKILITSEISTLKLPDGRITKPGLGSSAATVVALIKAILQFHGCDLEELIIFKLSVIAHYLFQKKIGSGADVAVSVFGKPIVYKRFDADWLIKKLQNNELKKIIDDSWPMLSVEFFELPEDFKMVVGFAGESSSTTVMAQKVFRFRDRNLLEYNQVMLAIDEVVCKLVVASKQNNQNEFLSLVRQNRRMLQDLTVSSGADIETANLKQLADIAESLGAAGKLSGAGGGDCCIAVCFDDVVAKSVIELWSNAGFVVYANSLRNWLPQ